MTVRFTKDRLEVPTSWPGVPTSFSAGGLTPFGHALKPDVTAPGANILSSTLPEYGGDPFVISAGTSFSAPHVSGAAALLLQRHPTWTPKQVKSALMSTAGRAFADTALTQEASVLLQGAGLVSVAAADRPVLFTDPQSLSFGYLDVNAGAASRAISVLVSDAGDGAGAWSVEVQPQVTLEWSERDSGAVHALERRHRRRSDGRERRRRERPRATTSGSSCFVVEMSSGASRTRSRSPGRS